MNNLDVIFIVITEENIVAVKRTNSSGDELYSGVFNSSTDGRSLARTVERIYSHVVKPYTNRAYIVVHNNQVREDLERDCIRDKKSFPLANIRWVIFTNLVWPLYLTERCESVDLQSVGGYLGIEAPEHRTAQASVNFLIRCYFAYLERLDMSLATQAVATKVVDGIKSFFS